MQIMAYSGDIIKFEDFELKGVTELSRDELGRGAYGRVYAVKYCQTICAAKELYSILLEGVGQGEMQRTIESFMRECRQWSTLRHPNVIQFLGIYYPTGAARANLMRLPVMIMEMMADSLTSFVDKHEKIPVHIKYSIVHDVSLGLCYLHNHDPPIVHRDLSPNNVLLTAHHVAKISDLGVAKVIEAHSRKLITKGPGTVNFMPPEALANNPVYGPSLDVFSFGGIILHTFNQQWPRPTEQVQFDPRTRKRVALSEVERRQQYLDKMVGEAEVLRPLVEECLDDDPAVRPAIATVCERIQVSKSTYMKESPQAVISLHREVEQLKAQNTQQKIENEQLRNEIEQKYTVVQQMSSTRSMPAQQVASQFNRPLREESVAKRLKLNIEPPPLFSALTSGRYHVKWTRLADLPVPLHDAYVTLKYPRLFVTGESSDKNALHQVYVYNTATDQWSELPPSGHYYGIPHVIGGRLAIVGGRLSATRKITKKVSTFDEDDQTWTSYYYPNLLSARSKPGVVSHLEFVIVAGGGRPNAEGDGSPVVQDDIEVLNWIENSHWSKVSIKLPVPMYGFTPIIYDDSLFTVGYSDADVNVCNDAYKIPVAAIIASIDHQSNNDMPPQWTKLPAINPYRTALVPCLSLPVIAGGKDATGTPTSDIKMYDNLNKSWKKIGSLSFARCGVAITSVHNNAIIVIGGYTTGGSKINRKSSNLTVVELGQAELRE